MDCLELHGLLGLYQLHAELWLGFCLLKSRIFLRLILYLKLQAAFCIQ